MSSLRHLNGASGYGFFSSRALQLGSQSSNASTWSSGMQRSHQARSRSGSAALRLCGEVVHVPETEVCCWGLCFRGCAAPHETLSCRECSPSRHRFLLREPQATDFAPRRQQNKAQFPAWRGDRVDAPVRTPGCKRCRGSEAPPECLRALDWHISSCDLPRRCRVPPDWIAERCHERLCGSRPLE